MGADCARFILGDYAFAVFERRHNRLTLLRDHIGTRPLYWAKRGDVFLFSSDIQILLSQKDFEWPVDEHSVARHLLGPNRPATKPFFEAINAVTPGSCLIVDANSFQERRWWHPQDAPDIRYRRPVEYVDHFRELMDGVARDHTATDLPVSTHLSGGIDSSAVTALSVRALHERGRTLNAVYSWSPPVSDAYPIMSKRDERHDILRIAEMLNVPVRFGAATPETQRRYLGMEIELNGIADLSDELPVLEAAARDGTGLVLSGWGGDEGFSAHGIGYLAFALKRANPVGIFKALRYYNGRRRPNPRNLAQAFWTWGILPMLPDTLYRRWGPFLNHYEGGAFPSDRLRALNPEQAKWLGEDVRMIADPRAYLVQLLLMGHLNMRMEAWAALSAHHGFQYRYPLLDRAILEFVLGMPRGLLFQDKESRYLARSVTKDILPPKLTKQDQANETLRDANHLGCWSILRNELRAGFFDGDSDWLDMSAFRGAIENVPSAMTADHYSQIAKILAATRIWHMERRVAL